ncbi:MAG: hypothetical protein ACFFDI_09920 [Promethearchaeota archaeon]
MLQQFQGNIDVYFDFVNELQEVQLKDEQTNTSIYFECPLRVIKIDSTNPLTIELYDEEKQFTDAEKSKKKGIFNAILYQIRKDQQDQYLRYYSMGGLMLLLTSKTLFPFEKRDKKYKIAII